MVSVCDKNGRKCDMQKSKVYDMMPFIIAFLLAVLAYLFYPVGGNYDLSKYYHLMDMIKIDDVESIIYINNYFEILFRIYMYVISVIGNYRLFQFFPVLIFYSILLYMIFDYGKTREYSNFFIALTCFLCIILFRFVLIVSAIRYALAYIIFAFALYLDLIKKRKGKLIKLLYILPIFIHKTSIILLLFRLLIEIKNKKIIYFIFVLFIFVFFFPELIISILVPFKNIKVIESLINMIYGYLIEENIPIYMQLIFRLIQTVFFVLCSFFCYHKVEDVSIKKYYFMLMLIGVFTVCLFKYFTIFMRMIDFVVFMSPIVIFEILKLIYNDKKLKKFYPCLLLFLGLMIGCGIYIQMLDFKEMFF